MVDRYITRWAWPASLLLAGMTFVLDLWTPLGFSCGALYVAIVLFPLVSLKTRRIFAIAGLCTLLTELGFFASPRLASQDLLYVALANRFFAILLIWIAVALVTHRRGHLEREWRRERQLSAAIHDGSATLFLMVDGTGQVSRMNPACEELVGCAHGEAIGRDVSHLFRGEDTDAMLQLIESSRRSESLGRVVEHRCADGKTRAIEWTFRRAPATVQGCEEIIGTGADLTERRQAETSLRESEELHRLTLSTISDAVFITDDEGRFVYICPNVFFIFALPRDEVIQLEKIFAILPELRFDFDQLHRTGELENIECSACDKLGERHDLLVTIKRVSIAGGSMLFTCRDITQRKRMEDALRKSESQFRVLFHESGVGLAVCRDDGVIEQTNRALQALFDRSADELRGVRLTSLFLAGSSEENASERRSQTDAQRGQHRVECIVNGEAGAPRWVRTTVSPILFGEDDRQHSLTMVEDFTNEKQMEEEIRQRLNELAHTARVNTVGGFATELAHELNQPLTAVSNYVQTCVRLLDHDGCERSNKMRNLLNQTLAQANRASGTIQQLRRFLRKREPNLDPVDLNLVIAELLGVLEIDTQRRGVALRFQPDAELPALTVDRSQLDQVLINLIQNALDAAESGSPAPQVTIATGRRGEDWIECVVRDNGPGFSEPTFNQLFEPYFTTKTDGMGMGLFICRTIIDLHAGAIWAASSQEGGASFHFCLPIQGECGAPRSLTNPYSLSG